MPNSPLRLLRLALLGTWVVALLFWELKRSLRPVVDGKLKRDVRNLVIAGTAAAAVLLFEVPVVDTLIGWAAQRHTGLLQLFVAPAWVKTLAALFALDYTLYLWHILTHRVLWLWRFHRVHHADREMDASTALRFHFGEITLSVVYRAAQLRLLGPSPAAYDAWQTFLLVCILFHHANIRLPLALERRLAWVFITPRLHGVHHSVVPAELNSNWSSGLSIWDRMHGTLCDGALRTRAPQPPIVIGVEGLRDDRDQTLPALLLLPFRSDARRVQVR